LYCAFALSQGKILNQDGKVKLNADVVELLGHPSKRCKDEGVVVALACSPDVAVVASEGDLLDSVPLKIGTHNEGLPSWS